MSSCGPREYATIRDSAISVSFSIYGGVSSSISTCANTVCADSPATVIVNVVPGVCGSSQITGLVDQRVFISSYSYSKDRTGHGTEQWQGNAYLLPSVSLPAGQYVKPVPTYVILGVAEGTIEIEAAIMTSTFQDMVGAHFTDNSIIMVTERANVQASQISIGEHAFIHNGTFKSIGASSFWDPTGTSGVLAKASVNLSLQPIWLG